MSGFESAHVRHARLNRVVWWARGLSCPRGTIGGRPDLAKIVGARAWAQDTVPTLRHVFGMIRTVPENYFRPLLATATGLLRTGLACALGVRDTAPPARGLFWPNFFASFSGLGVSRRRSMAIRPGVGAE